MKLTHLIQTLALGVAAVRACEVCEGDEDVVLTRFARRMQPGALGAAYGPKKSLAWGQLNFLHTTDTHGWLEGHLKEQNYGADWGDFVSFTKAMRAKAAGYGVDLLLVDTGDLHDGNGLSDATSLNGVVSNPIFENIDYDVLTIGNHELYVTDIAYETFANFSKAYGERYVTSNVQILNPATQQYEFIGKPYRYFTTAHGVRIMAFGVLYDFTGNSNVSKVIHATDLVQQTWFQNAINFDQPIDMFLLIGHNPVRQNGSGSTFPTIYNAIRQSKPDTPIQIFGGHTHIRDFAVYDQMTTALESGRYCETLGWLSINGLNSSTAKVPAGVNHGGRPAISINQNPKPESNSTLRYSRRYLDWNRLTFAYHAEGSQTGNFDYPKGKAVTKQITQDRQQLNLSTLYGCAPQSWCQSCEPFGTANNIFTVLSKALVTTVVNQTRKGQARMIILNTGSVRFDIYKGPFTFDDSFIVSPFDDGFQFLPRVPFANAAQVLGILNRGAFEKRDLATSDFDFQPFNFLGRKDCPNPPAVPADAPQDLRRRKLIRRQSQELVPGYTTSDDFGKNGQGDDTQHSTIAYYPQPNNFQANASFPANGNNPKFVDLVFLDFIAPNVLAALKQTGVNYTADQVSYYLPQNFTTNSYLPAYARLAPEWQANVPNCPVGGTGSVA